jgi:hypothetical protein
MNADISTDQGVDGVWTPLRHSAAPFTFSLLRKISPLSDCGEPILR